MGKMARGTPDYAPLMIWGSIGMIGAAGYALYRLRKANQASPPVANPPLGADPTLPAPSGFPIAGSPLVSAPAAPGVVDLTQGALQTLGMTFQGGHAGFVRALYTVRWAGNQWGQWADPVFFEGHMVNTIAQANGPPLPVWSSPDDDLVAYLDAITKSANMPAPGFWASYQVPIASEGFVAGVCDGYTTAGCQRTWGPASTWTTGRFGSITDANTDLPQWLRDSFHVKTSGEITEYANKGGYNFENVLALLLGSDSTLARSALSLFLPPRVLPCVPAPCPAGRPRGRARPS